MERLYIRNVRFDTLHNYPAFKAMKAHEQLTTSEQGYIQVIKNTAPIFRLLKRWTEDLQMDRGQILCSHWLYAANNYLFASRLGHSIVEPLTIPSYDPGKPSTRLSNISMGYTHINWLGMVPTVLLQGDPAKDAAGQHTDQIYLLSLYGTGHIFTYTDLAYLKYIVSNRATQQEIQDYLTVLDRRTSTPSISYTRYPNAYCFAPQVLRPTPKEDQAFFEAGRAQVYETFE